MNHLNIPNKQRGVTLIVGLIMLLIITLTVLTAFTLSSTNLKSVGNMQHRDEAVAAANVATEQVISSPAIFITPASEAIKVGNYTVDVALPTCLYATEVVTNSSGDQSPNIYAEGSGGGGGGGPAGYLDTYWDIMAKVNDVLTGTSVETHQGIKITLPAVPNPCP